MPGGFQNVLGSELCVYVLYFNVGNYNYLLRMRCGKLTLNVSKSLIFKMIPMPSENVFLSEGDLFQTDI